MLNSLNEALSSGDKEALLTALLNPALHLINVNPKSTAFYIRILGEKKSEKIAETGDDKFLLSAEDIQESIDLANVYTGQGSVLFLNNCTSWIS